VRRHGGVAAPPRFGDERGHRHPRSARYSRTHGATRRNVHRGAVRGLSLDTVAELSHERARLWLLPPLMVAWVNFHLGFVAGLGLILAFVGIDFLETLFAGERRAEAVQRLRRAWPWFLATAVATLANPWGWGIYSALARQNRAMAVHSGWIAEWGASR